MCMALEMEVEVCDEVWDWCVKVCVFICNEPWNEEVTLDEVVKIPCDKKLIDKYMYSPIDHYHVLMETWEESVQ